MLWRRLRRVFGVFTTPPFNNIVVTAPPRIRCITVPACLSLFPLPIPPSPHASQSPCLPVPMPPSPHPSQPPCLPMPPHASPLPLVCAGAAVGVAARSGVGRAAADGETGERTCPITHKHSQSLPTTPNHSLPSVSCAQEQQWVWQHAPVLAEQQETEREENGRGEGREATGETERGAAVEAAAAAEATARRGGGRRGEEGKVGESGEEEAGEIERAVGIVHGVPFTEKRSTFQAHLAPVGSPADVAAVMDVLLANRKIAGATHNIMAYRIVTAGANGSTQVIQGNDNDGEAAAGSRTSQKSSPCCSQQVIHENDDDGEAAAVWGSRSFKRTTTMGKQQYGAGREWVGCMGLLTPLYSFVPLLLTLSPSQQVIRDNGDDGAAAAGDRLLVGGANGAAYSYLLPLTPSYSL
ncbi:unnamed protein product [Closterium sp. NIES-65]|nr:unnamed protein product [Closterium sp. NIES-65]